MRDTRRKPVIMIVDDDSNDRFLLQTALKQIGVREPVYAVSDGAQAVAYLRGEREYADRETHPLPTLLLIDLKMPGMNGFELLHYLKENADLAAIPVVVLTSSTDSNDISNAYLLGANSYQVKAQSMAGLREQMRLIRDYWMHCEVPELDESGNLLPTEGGGKLSEGVLTRHEMAMSN